MPDAADHRRQARRGGTGNPGAVATFARKTSKNRTKRRCGVDKWSQPSGEPEIWPLSRFATTNPNGR